MEAQQMRFKLILGGIVAIATTIALFGTASAIPVLGGNPKPVAPWESGAVAVGAHSYIGDLTGVDRAEMQLRHEPVMTPPSGTGSGAFYGLGLKTDNGTFIQWGSGVLKSDGGNLGRLYGRVTRNGSEFGWYLSRAGTTNQPPADSCTSGDDTCHGYPFAIIVEKNAQGKIVKVKGYFDWILKWSLPLTDGGTKITDVYFLGQLAGAAPNDYLQPRTALTTYRVWNGGPTWIEPVALAEYFGAACPPYGVAYVGRSPSARRDGVRYHWTAVGSGVACTAAGTTLFTPSTP
jgi:hypothetical protein